MVDLLHSIPLTQGHILLWSIGKSIGTWLACATTVSIRPKHCTIRLSHKFLSVQKFYQQFKNISRKSFVAKDPVKEMLLSMFIKPWNNKNFWKIANPCWCIRKISIVKLCGSMHFIIYFVCHGNNGKLHPLFMPSYLREFCHRA